MTTIEDLRNPVRKSGFDHVGTGAAGKAFYASYGSKPHFAGEKTDGWRGPGRKDPAQAAQDYCDYIADRVRGGVERFVHHRRGRVDMLLMPTGQRHVDLAGRGGEVGVRAATVRGTPELDLQLRTEDEVDATLRALDPNVYWYVEYKAKGQAQDVNTLVGQLARRVLVHDYAGLARKAAVFGTEPSPESVDLLASQSIHVLVRP